MAEYRKLTEEELRWMMPWMFCEYGDPKQPGRLVTGEDAWTAYVDGEHLLMSGENLPLKVWCRMVQPCLSATVAKCLREKVNANNFAAAAGKPLAVMAGAFERLYDRGLMGLAPRFSPRSPVRFFIGTGVSLQGDAFLLQSPAASDYAVVVMEALAFGADTREMWCRAMNYFREISGGCVVDRHHKALEYGRICHVAVLPMNGNVRKLCGDMEHRLALMGALWKEENKVETYGPVTWAEHLESMKQGTALMQLAMCRDEVCTICRRGAQELGWRLAGWDEFAITVENGWRERRFFYDTAGVAEASGAYELGAAAMRRFAMRTEMAEVYWDAYGDEFDKTVT